MSEKTHIKVIAIDVDGMGWLSPWMGLSYVEGRLRPLAQHACSSPLYVPHDMGVTSDWKHDFYDEFFPDGWDIEYCGMMGHEEAIEHLRSVGAIEPEGDGA